ncbi:glycosyltransferase family 2 protein [Fusobacterium mortiferum]|uniref:glycosyltransferase family 2 protein n=1 Tax=Fusobacterium mortiferum TaxID=850 RepID=UPI003564459F
MKKISVILPVYNVEKYVRKCLLSIVEQSYQNFEVLIVDDGSVDNFFKEIEDIVAENKNIKIYQKANGGIASARNFGLEKANGDYILFIDSDDWIEKDLFKNLVENLSDEDILIFNLGEYSNKEGKIITNRRIKNINKELLKINEGYIFLDEVPNGATIKIYKRSFIEKNNFRFNEGLKLYEDTYWDIITLINTKKVRFLDYVGYWYRVGRDGSLITDLSSEKNKKYQLMIKELLLKLKDKNISELVKIKLEILT